MLEIFSRLLDTSDFPPRWHCGNWSDALGWLHIGSDLVIWLAYVAIPLTLGYFAIERRDIPFRRIFWLFGAFILACGTVHLVEATIFWWPVYRVQGLVKLVTAVVSVATVMAMVPVVPRALALRSPEELEHEVLERRRAETLFRGLLESAPDAMVIVDAQGQVVLANSRVEALFGYSPTDLIGQPVEVLVPERYRERHPAYRHAYFANPRARPMGSSLELHGRRRDGSEFPVEISLSPQQGEDGRTLVTAAIRDVTDRVEANQRLLRAERLAAIGEVVAGLAHEGRNALQQVQSCTAILRSKWKDRPADAEPLLDGVQKAQDRLHRMFEDVRQYAAPLRLDHQPDRLDEIWREAWAQTALARDGRHVELREELEAENLSCEVDRLRFEQVFRNLFENSLAAADDPAIITVRCREARYAGEPALEIRVRDNGTGVKADIAARVFEPFFTTKTHGTGLGLSISRRLVDSHGGSIELNAHESGGAEFVLFVPRFRCTKTSTSAGKELVT